MEVYTCFLIAIAWFAGCILNSLCGIGAALVALPFITLIMPVHASVLHGNLVSFIICVYQYYLFHKYREKNITALLTVSSIPGICLGVALLCIVPSGGLLLVIGAILLAYLFISNRKLPNILSRNNRNFLIGAGFFSGIMQCVASMGGPPVSIYALRMGWTPKTIMGTLATYFIYISLMTGGAQFLSGLMTREIVISSIYGSIGGISGFYIGSKLLQFVNLAFCRKLLFTVIVYCALSCMWRGCMQLQ